MSASDSGYGRGQLMGIVAVFTFGLTSLTAVLGGGALVPAIFITGFFLILPLIGLLGDDFPLVEESDEAPQPAPRQDPVETLRERYASGEITQAEFERRLEYLVETEDLNFDVGNDLGQLDTERTDTRERERR